MPEPDAASEQVQGFDYAVAQHIRPLAIVVFRREDGCILAAPGFDRVKQQRFYRPLGGGIEFGEPAADAARREIREELGAEIDDLRLLGVSENVFTYLGQRGHEIVFTYEARFIDPSFYTRDVLIADESGSRFEAHWVSLARLQAGETPLYPDGLLALLTEASTGYYEYAMGLTHVNIAVASVANPERTETVRLMVDSGAIYSVIPEGILERLGVVPFGTQTFEMANGETMTRRRGTAHFRYGDRAGGADVVFGEAGDANLLGAFTLESLGLGLDPLRRRLIELPMILGGMTQ